MRGVDLIVKPEPGVTTEEATDDVTALMRARRGLRSTAKNNFEIVTQDRLMAIYNKLFGSFFVVGLALSSVGLLVGGVGVVAIMMISVTERTSEIGVRKALGATRSAILWQFLVEAATLTSIGAAIGLVLAGPVVDLLGPLDLSLDLLVRFAQHGPHTVGHLGGLLLRDHALLDQLPGKELANRGMALDPLVHLGPGSLHI